MSGDQEMQEASPADFATEQRLREQAFHHGNARQSGTHRERGTALLKRLNKHDYGHVAVKKWW
jgi:hypothetical protein